MEKLRGGDTTRGPSIQPIMKLPTDQRERNEDKKRPEQNPSRGIDPKADEKEMEVVDQDPGSPTRAFFAGGGVEDPGSPTRAFFAGGGVEDPGHRQKENQNQKKDDDLAA